MGTLENIIIIIILLLLVGFASFYIWRAKKHGKKCIGCPASGNGTCPKHCGCGSKIDK